MQYKTEFNLKNIKDSQGISLNKLHKETGVSHDFLTALDKNKLVPTFDKLEKIANALNVPIENLVQFVPVSDSLDLNFLGAVYHKNDNNKAKITALMELDKERLRFAGIMIFELTKSNDHSFIINVKLPLNIDISQVTDSPAFLRKIGQISFLDQSNFFSAFYQLSSADHKTLAADIIKKLNGFLIERSFVQTFDFKTMCGINYSYWLSWCNLWNFLYTSDNEKSSFNDLIAKQNKGLFYKNTPLKLIKQSQIETDDLYFE